MKVPDRADGRGQDDLGADVPGTALTGISSIKTSQSFLELAVQYTHDKGSHFGSRRDILQRG